MCGINGVVFMNGVKRSEEMLKQIRFVFNEMFVNTQARGEHATGLVHFKRNGGYDFHKAALSAQQMVTNDETYNQIIDGMGVNTFSIIGHTRYFTKGKPDNNDNNHPFDIGNVVGVHNGTITNDDMLFKKFEKDFSRIAEVDSEIIYQMINHYNSELITYEGLREALEKTLLRGLFGLAFAHKNQPNLVHIVKQEKPLSIAYWQEAGVVFFNSQTDLMENAFDSLTRMGRTLGFTTSTSVEYTVLKDDIYLTLDANGTTIDEMLSDPQRLYILSSSAKTYTTYTGGTSLAKNGSTRGTGGGTTTSVSTKDSVGRIIEGELDEETGEVILFTANSLLASDDGAEDEEEADAPQCSECLEWLSDEEMDASFNESNPKDGCVCYECYEAAFGKLLSGHA